MRSSSLRGVVFAVAVLLLVPLKRAESVDPRVEPKAAVDQRRNEAALQEQGFVEPKPGQQHAVGGWYLGVYGKYTTTGLLLTEVYPNTAASRVGLEVGDRIVAVNGRQIGIGLHSRLTLDVALQSSTNGFVRLLVQDRRTMQLVNLDVRLTRGRVHT